MNTKLRSLAAASLLFTLCVPALSQAGPPVHSIHGHGKWGNLSGLPDGGNHFDQVSINARFDDDGLAEGILQWTYETNPLPGGGGQTISGYPWTVAIDTVFFVDVNAVYVSGVVINSGQVPEDVGAGVGFFIVDNGKGGDNPPDELNGSPIDAGNFTIK